MKTYANSKSVIVLFEKFIRDSRSGRRLKADGTRIKTQTISQYQYVLKYLVKYEKLTDKPLNIITGIGKNKRTFESERQYWKKFYLGFTAMLFHNNCYDNYVGSIIKIIRSFFNYLNKDLNLSIGNFHNRFYVYREEIPVITLKPEQLKFLIADKEFEAGLSEALRKTKDIFVFGCTVALRVSDLFKIKPNDFEEFGDVTYLVVKAKKTGKVVRIKLPPYALDIISNFRDGARKRKTIFPGIQLTKFNKDIKEIALKAGWTGLVPKKRTQRGIPVEQRTASNDHFRFCDLVSSHTMRRTAITTMLLLGMKELMVREISGHASNNKSFSRYINFVQSYLDTELDGFHQKMMGC